MVDRDGDRLSDAEFLEFCPYGQPGDRLWVREKSCYRGYAGGIILGAAEEVGPHHCVWRPDDFLPVEKWGPYRERYSVKAQKWCPSIHMPRWASRITLEVTEVRVQRLQDCSFHDAMDEGINGPFVPGEDVDIDGQFWPAGQRKAVKLYAELWDSINGKRPGFDWKANPWVWAIGFKRLP